MDIREKEESLDTLLRGFPGVLVAFSGGVDSSYLAYKAHSTLGNRALVVMGLSPSVPSHQKKMAVAVAEVCGFSPLLVQTGEVERTDYNANPPNRCYFCKDELFSTLAVIARERGGLQIVDGLNADDVSDYRPGTQAGREHGVRSPLLEAGLSKSEIRVLSREAGLPTADQPASACLASRFPYGVAITPDRLRLVDAGEEALREMGFRVFRVRHHEETVRLEFGEEDFSRALDREMAARLVTLFKSLGYKYVTLDLEGYRTGSLNEVLTQLR
jgi:pyridinium-3,5-biscarboxylic acid mononucleotide sulfurtransferase